MKNTVVVCPKSVTVVTYANRPVHLYPENGLMPEDRVRWAEETVRDYAHRDKGFLVVTVSPYVLKAIEVYSDEYEVGEDVEYVGPDGRAVGSTQELFRLLSIPFSRLMHGEHYENNKTTKRKKQK